MYFFFVLFLFRDEMTQNCNSNESLGNEKTSLERLLKVVESEELEKDKEKCIEYMKALSVISVYNIIFYYYSV